MPDEYPNASRSKDQFASEGAVSQATNDQNFKNLILDYPRAAIEFFAPEEAAQIDDSVLITPVREEQLKDRLSDRFLELDVPLKVEWPDGRREALLFVIEQQTRSHTFSVHKLARYCLELAELLETDRVVPVVIFLRRAGQVPDTLALGSENRDYLRFRYLRCVLADLPGEQFMDSGNLVARLNLPNMRWPARLKLAMYASATRGLVDLEPDGDLRIKYLAFIDIYAALDDNERMQYREQYLTREDQQMTGFAEYFQDIGRAEGLQQGREQGRQEGRQEGARFGEAAILCKLLSLRFGPLSPEILGRIADADTNRLEAWAERVLDAKTIDDIFAPR